MLEDIFSKIDNVLPDIEIIEQKIIKLNEVCTTKEIIPYQSQISTMSDVLSNLKSYILAKVEKDKITPDRLDEYHQKLSKAEALRKKYNLSLEKLKEKYEEDKKKLSFLEEIFFTEKEIEQEFNEKTRLVRETASLLQRKREESKKKFESLINNKIRLLGMQTGQISIEFNNTSDLTKDGIATARFVYRSADETSFSHLNKVASGGEISRIMLAFKSILSEKLPNDTIIFDEIDVGIGGNIAFAIGQEMKYIVKNKQLLVITHLPQIAKYADRHFVIKKKIDNKVSTLVETLDRKERVREISRMLGGKAEIKDLEYAENFLLQ